MNPGTEIRFGDWTLNRQSGELRKGATRVRLQTHPQQVLEALLARPGELVTREQLISALWPKGVVDFDTALNSTVRRLRIALGDDAEAPRYIETLPRRGYRFIGTIEPASPPDAQTPVASHPEPTVPAAGPIEPQAETAAVRRDEPTRRRWGRVAGTVLLTAAAMAVGGWWWNAAPETAQPGNPSSGLVEDAYQRARFLMGRRGDGDIELARQYFEDAIRLDPRFADAWAGLASAHWLLTIEGRVARAEGLSRLRDAAEHALQLDSTLAEPHLRLANYRWIVGNRAAAAEHLRRAAELEPHNPLVLTFAASRAADEGALADAVDLQRRAVEAEPLSGALRYNLATMLLLAGRFDDAEVEARRLQELNPAVPNANELLGIVLVARGRYVEALAATAADPPDAMQLQVRALAHFGLGQREEGQAALRALIEVCPKDERYRVAEVYAFIGQKDAAFEWLAPPPSAATGVARSDVAWFVSYSPFLESLRSDPRWVGGDTSS